MNKTVAATFLAIACALTGCDDKAAQEPPKPVDIHSTDIANKDTIQKAFSAYFNAHSLTVNDVTEGLTIHYVDPTESSEKWGYLVATGEFDRDGSIIFNLSEFENDGKFGSRENKQIKLKP
jgi:hypothetical protein